MDHPPTGEEFVLGCAICGNIQSFWCHSLEISITLILPGRKTIFNNREKVQNVFKKKGGHWSGENVAQKNIQVFSTRSWMCLHILCEFLWHVLQKNLIPCWSSCGTVGEERPAGVSDYPGSSAPSIFLFSRSLSEISSALHLAIWLTRDLIRIKTSGIWGWTYFAFNISENRTEVGLQCSLGRYVSGG